MAEDYSEDLLIGTKFADQAEAWIQQNAKKAGEWYKDASADQAGIGDDILRLLGGGAKNVAWASQLPGIKQGFQVLGAAGHYGGILGGKAAEAVGIDPRIGGFAGNVIGDVAFGGAVAKAGKVARAVRAVDKLPPLTSGGILNPGPGAAGLKPTGLRKISKVATAGGAKQDDLIRAAKWIQPDADNIYNITKKDIPQIKHQLGEWLQDEYAKKGSVLKIKRQEFGTIVVDGDAREVSRITRFLEGTGELPDLPKVVTRTQARHRRLQRTKPPTVELRNLGKQKGLSHEEISDYIREAQESFGQVAEAARRTSTFRGEYHAGHFYPAARGGPTTGRAAGIELGKLNVTKGAKLEGSINLYAAKKAGIPTTWAEDMDMWIKLKKGQPITEYKVEFSNAQRDLIESIPWHWNESKVNAFFKENKIGMRYNPDIGQMKALYRELGPAKTYNRTKLKTPKKIKPTQFPDNIQRHIQRSQEIGITEPQWKSGSIDYTWRPQSNTGQIDIPPQSAKGFKGLRDEFFEQIKDLPSGSVWELNPKFKDEKRRRIYARLFGKDKRITRNPDETLGWVLKVP